MNPLVSPQWLAGRLRDPECVILDATLPPVGVTPAVNTHEKCLVAHLPGALFFDIEELSEHSTSLPHMLPAPERFARDMATLGVSNTATILVYEQGSVFSAPRAWWMLRTFGATDVSILDGGLRAWTDAGLPTEAGPVQRQPAPFKATLDESAVTDLSGLQESLRQGEQVLDARSAGRFHGRASEPRAGLSSGHMPGALTLPYAAVTDGDRLLPATALRRVFEQAGVDLQRPVTTT